MASSVADGAPSERWKNPGEGSGPPELKYGSICKTPEKAQHIGLTTPYQATGQGKVERQEVWYRQYVSLGKTKEGCLSQWSHHMPSSPLISTTLETSLVTTSAGPPSVKSSRKPRVKTESMELSKGCTKLQNNIGPTGSPCCGPTRDETRNGP